MTVLAGQVDPDCPLRHCCAIPRTDARDPCRPPQTIAAFSIAGLAVAQNYACPFEHDGLRGGGINHENTTPPKRAVAEQARVFLRASPVLHKLMLSAHIPSSASSPPVLGRIGLGNVDKLHDLGGKGRAWKI